ncbi:MAG: MaoC family dehydratase N-terminal domain-containing protein [Dehalococcoidia bacterium]|nr:MaoC family dehydratase N-terminal domain-containing protein [Dehalococcoidia bacterium]
MKSIIESLRDRLGNQAPPIQYVIDEGSISYFADAIMDADPRYKTDVGSDASKYNSLVAPPTFFGSATGLRGIAAGDSRTMSALELPLPEGWARLATGDEFEFYRPVTAGMVLTAQERFLDVYERLGRSGKLIFYTIEKVFTTLDGELVLKRVLHGAAREPIPFTASAASRPPVETTGEPTLPQLTVGPISVRYLAMFATATAEFVDIHYDADYARTVGLPGPIIQGLYKTALIARLIKDWTGDAMAIRSLNVRHSGMDLAGSILTVGGTVNEGAADSPHNDVVCDVWVRNQDNLVTTSGFARVGARLGKERAAGMVAD